MDGPTGPQTLATQALCRPGAPQPGWVTLDAGRIVGCGTGDPPADAVDLGDAVLAPGFVDLQCNGLGPVDLATADPDAWRALGRDLARRGTTSYCPTLISTAPAAYGPFLALVDAQRAAPDPSGAAVLGAHLEGPFLGGAPGVHPPEHVRAADPAWLGDLLDRHPGAVRVVTLAPEADPGLAATRLLVARDVVVSLGHSTAGADEVRAAATAGARGVTHLFNAMAPMRAREPGLAGVALDDERLTPTVIADLAHVAPELLRLALAATDRIVLVSDAVAGDATDGAVRDGAGRLQGAAVTLERAVANLLRLGVPIERAVAMASALPADLLGLRDRGRIAPGAHADLVALDPGSGAVRRVWVGGIPLDGSVGSTHGGR